MLNSDDVEDVTMPPKRILKIEYVDGPEAII
jgi:hypothetical protein